MADNPFAATAATLGYAYQFRYGLMVALETLRSRDGVWAIAMETADDLVVAGGDDQALMQTKLRSTGSLTNASADFWKTLRVWATQVRGGLVDPTATDFFLITTQRAPDGSIPARLLERDHDPAETVRLLTEVADASDSKSLKASFDAFSELTRDQAEALVERIRVVAEAPDIVEVEGRIRGELRSTARSEHLEAFAQRLEGYWFRRCLQQLTGATPGAIDSDELSTAINDLRDQFGPESLPIDDQYDYAPALEDFKGRTFVLQLELIKATGRQLVHAISDYMRAFEQTSRWTRDGLLGADELDRYETRLVREWENVFEQARAEVGDEVADEAMQDAAMQVYKWVSTVAQVPIRPKCTEPFLTRGQLHSLADQQRVGWHLDFEARLAALLEPTGQR